jgi:hypothetical protein
MLYRTTTFDLTELCLVQGLFNTILYKKNNWPMFQRGISGEAGLHFSGMWQRPFSVRRPSLESYVAHIQISHFSVIVIVCFWFILRRCQCARLYYVGRCVDWWMLNCEGYARTRSSFNWCSFLPFDWRGRGKSRPPSSGQSVCQQRLGVL